MTIFPIGTSSDKWVVGTVKKLVELIFLKLVNSMYLPLNSLTCLNCKL
jgi:hypothetical protein